MRQFIFIVVLLLQGMFCLTALGQGFLIDERPDFPFRLVRPPNFPLPTRHIPTPTPMQTYKVKELLVQANLTDQVAKVQVSQTFVNTGSSTMEVGFVFPLPYDGAVDRLTFLVDGKEYEAKLLDAAEARRIYEGYLRRNRDPALLEWLGHGLFKTSVFPVPPGAERTVTLRYSQVCRKAGGLTEMLFPLSAARFTAAPIEKVRIQVNLVSQSPLKNIYSPSHAISIQRQSDKHAEVSFSRENESPAADFRLFYDTGSEAVSASVLSFRHDPKEDGYFLMLLSPEIKKTSDQLPKKNVIFVVDRSGSMAGQKLEQAKGAVKFVLNNLREGDLFNVVAYDGVVESFRPELQRFDEATRQAAIGFVSGIFAGGGTNIDGALTTALGQIQDNSRPNYILFLTDGLPTAGETREAQIVANSQERNKIRTRIFTMGVGYDVNSRLLDKLSRVGFGQSEYVRPNEDIEAHVSKLYNRIGAPALTELAIQVDVEGAATIDGPVSNRVYPRDAYDLFAGDQLVLAGRYRKSGAAKITVTGKVDGQKQTFHFPASLVEKSADDSQSYIEKLWAMRRVGEIIDEIDLRGKNQELIDELILLSKKHGILTPYTSFLADDSAQPRTLAEQRRDADRSLNALNAAEGLGGFVQRSAKADLQRASTAPTAGAAPRFRAANEDREIEVRTILNVGSKTFFFRQGRWVDSSLTPEQESQAKKIDRFSDDVDSLLKKHGANVGKYLAIDGDVVVQIADDVIAF